MKNKEIKICCMCKKRKPRVTLTRSSDEIKGIVSEGMCRECFIARLEIAIINLTRTLNRQKRKMWLDNRMEKNKNEKSKR